MTNWIIRKPKVQRINPFQPSATFHIETSHLFFSPKQMTGFYMKCNTGAKRVKTHPKLVMVIMVIIESYLVLV